MKKLTLALLGVALAAMPSTPLVASTIFNFTFTGNSSASGAPSTPFSGAGQLTANEIGVTSEYTVIGITGTTDGLAITGLLKAGKFAFNDDLLFYTAGSGFAAPDNGGISYTLAGGADANFHLNAGIAGDGQQLFGGSPFLDEEQSAIVTITPASAPAPEPGTLFLLGTGMLGMVGAIRKKIAV